MDEANTYWWLSPYSLGAWFIAPLFLFVVATYQGSVGISFLTRAYILLGLLFILIFSIGAYSGSKLVAKVLRTKVVERPDSPNAPEETRVFRKGYLDFLAITAILAYVIWFHKLFTTPSLMIAILKTGRGLESGVRGTITTIPGVTTLTQLGVIYVIAYTGMKKVWKVNFPERRYRVYCYTLIALAFVRMLAWTERLALLEIVIPIIVIWMAFTRFRKVSLLPRLIQRFGPYVGLFFLFCFFAFTEYFRSWGSYYRFETTQGFLPFIANRLFTYYSSSLNNGAGLLASSTWPDGNMTFLLSWFYNFPCIGKFFQNPALFNPTLQFLNTYGNPQFNTTAGLYAVIFDLGAVGGLLGAAVWGILAGVLYQLFIHRRPTGVLLYPVFYVSILEMLRELYLTETRAFPILIFSLLGAWFFTTRADIPTPAPFHPSATTLRSGEEYS